MGKKMWIGTKEHIQIVNKCMKRHSMALVIRQMQIEITIWNLSRPNKMAKMRKTKKYEGWLGSNCIFRHLDENVNWHSHLGKLLDNINQVEHIPTLWPSNSTSRDTYRNLLPKRSIIGIIGCRLVSKTVYLAAPRGFLKSSMLDSSKG